MGNSADFQQGTVQQIDDLSINTIRTLAMDAVQQAESGHPGTPMAMAPAAYVLWTQFLQHNPKNPHWFNRDRFVLSMGHASMLLYPLLHLTGYELSLDDIRQFRQWGSRTPGHPEYGITPGVETSTGPLGQGIMNAVGMAMAEAHLAAVYNRPDFPIIDHFTYVFCSDGDLMEGASHEAASLAGHLGLGKLIVLYDDNRISIEGATDLAFSDDTARRFEGYHWQVQDLGDAANDLDALRTAFNNARADLTRPSLIIVRSHIGYGAPGVQDSADAHGSPLGEEEIRGAKRHYGWPEDARFMVPDAVRKHLGEAVQRGVALENDWKQLLTTYKHAHPALAEQLNAALWGELPPEWDEDLPRFQPGDGAVATRSASGKVLNALAERIPWLIGGSADLAPSTNTLIKSSGDFEKGAYDNRNIHWGVRELCMAAASSGLFLHGGLRPFAATFFVFTDYARPAIRLAALMELPVVYIMTHDSIGLGEDGPTHQPIEHLASLRAMPNLHVIRPADANETGFAWRAALARRDGPTVLVLTRQKVPVLDQRKTNSMLGVLKGGYILLKEPWHAPDLILIATGSEVHLAMAAQQRLAEEDIGVRVVSLPCWELFRAQPKAYRDTVLPPRVTARLAIEAGASFGWREWVGDDGVVIGIDRFGASAPGEDNFQHFGFTVEHILEKARKLLGK